MNGQVKVNYQAIDQALGYIEKDIASILQILASDIPVTSYEGDAQETVQSTINNIKNSLKGLEQPIKEISEKVNEIKTEYQNREKGIQSALGDGQSSPDSGMASNGPSMNISKF